MSGNNSVVTKPVNLAQAWKKQTLLVEFPSGLKAEMLRPDAIGFLTEDKEIPDSFFKYMTVSSSQEAETMMKQMSPDEIRENTRLMRYFAFSLMKQYSLNPKVVEANASENEIDFSDLDVMMDSIDRNFIINWGMFGGTPADALTRFRAEQARRIHALQNGGEVS